MTGHSLNLVLKLTTLVPVCPTGNTFPPFLEHRGCEGGGGGEAEGALALSEGLPWRRRRRVLALLAAVLCHRHHPLAELAPLSLAGVVELALPAEPKGGRGMEIREGKRVCRLVRKS